MKIKWRLRTLCLLLCACVLLTAPCGCKKKEVITTGRMFRVELSVEPTSLDPQVATDAAALAVIENVFEGLTRVDSRGVTSPGVAERWESNADNTVYTFYLRADAKWNDETPVTAQDFYFAVRRALDPATRAASAAELFGISGAQALYNGEADAEALGVTVVNDREIRFTLAQPDDEFAARVAKPVFMPCNEKFFRRSAGAYGMESETTLCNGTFRFRKTNGWLHNTYVYLIKNEQYAGEKKVLPSAVMMTIEKPQEPLQTLLAGDAHLIEIDAASVKAAQSNEDVALAVDEYGTATAGLFFNTTDAVFSNEAIRTALICAISGDALNSLAEDGQVRTHALIPSATVYGGKSYREAAGACRTLGLNSAAAVEKMKDGLAQAGLSGLSGVAVLCVDTPQNRQILNVFLTAWYNVFGYYLNMDPVEEKEYNKRVSAGDFQVAFGAVTSAANDAASFLKAVRKLVRLESEELETLLTAKTDVIEAYLRAENLLIDSGVFYPVFEQKKYYARYATVKGIELNPFSGAVYFRSGERS